MSEPLLFKVTGPIYLEPPETAFLMQSTTPAGNPYPPLSLEFGPGWVRLRGRSNPESDWAVPILAKLRGISDVSGLIVFGASEQ